MSKSRREPDEARGVLALMFDREFGMFFWGRLLTAAANWIHTVVASIVVFEQTGSALGVALVTGLQYVPQLLLAPLTGRQADSGNPTRQIVTGRLLCATGSGVLAIWLTAAQGPPGWAGAAVIMGGSLITGLGQVIGGPAMQAVTPLLVSRRELPAAMALNTSPVTVGRFGGPAVGAALAVGLGASPAFSVAAMAHLVFVGMMLAIHIPQVPRTGRDNFTMKAALAHVGRDRPLLMLLVATTALGYGSEPVVTLAPPLARELGGGASTVGVLTTSFGAGSAVGLIVSSILAQRLRHTAVPMAGILLMAAALAAPAFGPWTALAVVAFGAAGFGFVMALTSSSTLIQLRVPAPLRGRVMALWLMGLLGTRPLAAVTVGLIADHAGVGTALVAIAASLTVAGYLCRPARVR
jgi:MFS family permease